MADIFQVKLDPSVKKVLNKFPKHIVRKLLIWAESVENYGLRNVQKVPGYHDEPLRGKRFGQRSIRLNRAYRAIYVSKKGKEVEFISGISWSNLKLLIVISISDQYILIPQLIQTKFWK